MKTIEEKVSILILQVGKILISLNEVEKEIRGLKKFIVTEEDLNQVIRLLKKEIFENG